MRCTACGKESNNQRVCPHCFMPYEAGGEERTTQAVPRATQATPRATQATPRQTTAQPASRATVRDQAAVPPRGTVRDLPAVGVDPAIDRALSGLPMPDAPAPDPPFGIVGRTWQWYRGQSGIVRGLLPVIVLLIGIAFIPMSDMEHMGPGVTVPKGKATDRIAAESLLAQTRQRATVEQSGEDLVVTYGVMGFPSDEAGQQALAEAYARADALVAEKRRTINFYSPQGRVFAKSDSVVGVVLRR